LANRDSRTGDPHLGRGPGSPNSPGNREVSGRDCRQFGQQWFESLGIGVLRGEHHDHHASLIPDSEGPLPSRRRRTAPQRSARFRRRTTPANSLRSTLSTRTGSWASSSRAKKSSSGWLHSTRSTATAPGRRPARPQPRSGRPPPRRRGSSPGLPRGSPLPIPARYQGRQERSTERSAPATKRVELSP
jgi:hypothetical protein